MRGFRLKMVCLLMLVSQAAMADTGHWLFAVDVSLSTQQRTAVANTLSQVVSQHSPDRVVGLVLFDDTVRSFVKAGPLQDMQQLQRLKNTLADMPESIRSTSNLAAGIERAIDDAVPVSGAELFVFSRGVIDTETDDPRARFHEWLDQVLLKQAQEKNIRITLVVPTEPTGDKGTAVTAITSSDFHRLVPWHVQQGMPSTLIASLDLPLALQMNEPASDSSEPAPPSLPPVAERVDPLPEVESPQTGTGLMAWLTHPDSALIRLVLLLLSCLVLALLFLLRRRSRHREISEATTQHSASYLPLSTKPGVSMSQWTQEDVSRPSGQRSRSVGSDRDNA